MRRLTSSGEKRRLTSFGQAPTGRNPSQAGWLLLALLVACDRPPQRPSHPIDQTIRLRGIALDGWIDDRLRHHATARSARIDRDRKWVELSDIELAVRGRSGAVVARVSAPQGRFGFSDEKLEMRGGVRLVDARDRVVSTEEAHYDAKTEVLSAPTEVRVEGENFSLRGPSGRYEAGQERVRIEGPVEATVRPDARGGARRDGRTP